ncbi:hypothetical protein JW905_14835, partial [bacterium]|nr:hypothetical protein [candidate division CSSED10-310 bacterium]
KLFGDHLFISGNQGLTVYNAASVRIPDAAPEPVAYYWGVNVYGLDVATAWESSPEYPYNAMIALAEWGSTSLHPRLVLLSLCGDDLFERSATNGFNTWNLGAVALDPDRRQVYVGGWVLGSIFALDCEDPAAPVMIAQSDQQHPTHHFVIHDSRLWSSRSYLNATNHFAAFSLEDATLLDLLGTVGEPLPFFAALDLDGCVLCGSSGTGGRAYLIDPAATDFGSQPEDEVTLFDLAYDVACENGVMLIANEWVGMVTYTYDNWQLTPRPELRMATGGFSQRMWGALGEVYVAQRGGGLWLASWDALDDWSTIREYGTGVEDGLFIYAGCRVPGGSLLLAAAHTIMGSEGASIQFVDDALNLVEAHGIDTLDDDDRGYGFGRVVQVPSSDTYLLTGGRHEDAGRMRGIVSCRLCAQGATHIDQVRRWGSMPLEPPLKVFDLAVKDGLLLVACGLGDYASGPGGRVQAYEYSTGSAEPDATILNCDGSGRFHIPEAPEYELEFSCDVWALTVQADGELAAVALSDGLVCFSILDDPPTPFRLEDILEPTAHSFLDVAFDGAGYLYATSPVGVYKLAVDAAAPALSKQVAFYPGTPYDDPQDVYPDPDIEALVSPQGLWISQDNRVFVSCRTGVVYELRLPGGTLPTPTPVPPCGDFGVEMLASHAHVSPGDTFWILAGVCNPDLPVPAAPFVAMLDIGIGEYWFFPRWLHWPPDFDFLPTDLETGVTSIQVLAPFTWPDTGADSLDGITMYGAILTTDMTAIHGEIGSVSFGFGPK